MEWVFTKYKTASAETIEVWQELNRNFAAGHPALDNMFLSTLAKYFGSGDELLGLCSDHSGYVAAVIVNPEGRGVWSCFAPGQDCLCSFLISPSGDLESIMSTLLNMLPGNCWLLKMPKLDPMFHSVENLGKLDCAETGYYGTTYTIDLQGDFDNYWSGRSKNLRRSLRKSLESIERSAFNLKLSICRKSECIADSVSLHGLLESSGWKGAAGTAIRSDNVQGAFYKELLLKFSRAGGAVMAQMYIDEQPAASLLCVEKNGMVIVLKIAFEKRYSNFGPGRLLDYLFLQQCNDINKFKSVEMYTKASKSDLSWATRKREMYDIYLFRSRLIKSVVRIARSLKTGFRKSD